MYVMYTEEEVTGGEAKVNIIINNIPFLSIPINLCHMMSKAGLPCPIKPGSHVLTATQLIPDEAPSVRYNK